VRVVSFEQRVHVRLRVERNQIVRALTDAELVKVPVPNLVPIPDEIDFVHAAAFPLTFLTAWHMLITRAKLARGEDVLVLAAGSGVGQAAIQIARARGATVYGTASPGKWQFVRDQGVAHVMNSRTLDFAALGGKVTFLRTTQAAATAPVGKVRDVFDVQSIRLDREVPRGAELAVPRSELPPPEEDEYYAFQLVGLQVEEDGGRPLGRVTAVQPGVANDVLELNSGDLLPLVDACVLEVDLERGRIVVAQGFQLP